MTARNQAIPLLLTKLHRTPVAGDLVLRASLLAELEQGRAQPLTLVSAPAGYGKSTLISNWLGRREGAGAWLSLDETDSDPRVFLSYVVAAVHTVFPDTCQETLSQLAANELPSVQHLGAYLSNDLEVLPKPLVLVLDDYHRIKEAGVHELLDQLLAHPPATLHLVILTRRDPPLALGALRAHGLMGEIRARDLRFTNAETAAFLERASGHSIEDSTLKRLHETIEGWAVGLRLAALALRNRSDVDAFVRGFGGDTRQVQEYLVTEVLSHQPPALRDWLCQTALLERFCAPLCEVVCTPRGNADGKALDGPGFVTLLEGSGLPCVALDQRGEWYRYHHLVQELLQRQLKARLATDEIAGLHRRAAVWFEEHELLEEAIHHALEGDGPREASRLIVRHRNDILNGEQWHRLALWLNRLPAEVVENDPELLMLKAWHWQNQGRHMDAAPILDRVEELTTSAPPGPAATARLRGAIDALRGYRYHQLGETDVALKCAEHALNQLPPDCMSERGYALVIKSAALRASGNLEAARNVIYEALADTSVPMGTFQGRLLMALSLINWVAADLPAMRLAANQYLELGEKIGLAESVMNAHYFLGSVQYHQNELSKAEASLVHVVSDRKAPNQQLYTESVFALACVYEARGQAEKARATVESVCERMLNIRNTTLLQRAQAYQADLALHQGRMAEAVNWARGFDPEPFQNMYRFHEPRMTLARVLIAQGNARSLERAASLLTRLETFLARIHSTRFLIEVLALQALLHDARGDEPAACDVLARAVSLAQPGGFIRLFVDLAPGLAKLLNRLNLDQEGLRYVGRILAAFRADGEARTGEVMDPPVQGKASTGRQPLPEPLTKRELEILAMLANRLSNKEIADRLYISAATAKRHIENIYHKLGVHSRHEAVAKARALGLPGDG